MLNATELPYRLTLDIPQRRWHFGLNDGREPILTSHSPLLLFPEIAGSRLVGETARVESDYTDAFGRRHLVLSALSKGTAECRVVNELIFFQDRLVCRSGCDLAAGGSVAYWHIAPQGGILDADDVHAYIGSPERVENGRVFRGATIDISTASHNWLYSPMAPRIMLRRGNALIGLGGTTLAHDFGLHLKLADEKRIRHLRFDYGGPEAPFTVKQGRWTAGPRLQIQVTSSQTFDRAHGLFTQAMIDDGMIGRRVYRPEHASWRRAWYCTFGDQMALAKQAPANQAGADRFLNQELVLRAANTIRENHLDIGTFIIDAGWADRAGDWNLNTDRFPDMRALIEQLHAMDFNVVLWWAPFKVDAGARILKKPGLTVRNPKYGHPVLNYTHPETRAHIQKQMHTWFDNGPDGWDIDSLKIDFMAENVFPNPDDQDSEWRGEERLFHQLFRMIHETITQYKDSPGLLGEAFNPFLATYCVAFQFEERFDRNLAYIDKRPAMADALLPGAWYAPHFTYHTDLVCDYARRVKAVEGIPQIGTLLSDGMTPAVFDELRTLLND